MSRIPRSVTSIVGSTLFASLPLVVSCLLANAQAQPYLTQAI